MPDQSPPTEAIVSSMSINNIMAIRSAVLEKNAALRNVASTPLSLSGPGAAGKPTFEVAMNTALQKVADPNSIRNDNGPGGVAPVGTTQQGGFASTFQSQLQKMNAVNARAGALTVAYERGEETDIAKVMLARQEASIGFEATLQVRNKLLSAYKDIMSMPI